MVGAKWVRTTEELFGVGEYVWDWRLKATCAFLQAGGGEDGLRQYHLFENHP